MSAMDTTERTAVEHALKMFRADTADHTMEIAFDQGLYPHLRFRNSTGSRSSPPLDS